MVSNNIILRIAPTPSGFLHLGNAYNFLFTYLLSVKKNAQLLLRIDDIDHQRKKMEYVEDIFTQLNWLGISWQKGPLKIEDTNSHSQLNRLNNYNQYLIQLQQGGYLFNCVCSRKQLAENPATNFCIDKNIPFSQTNSWRLRTDLAKPISFFDAFENKNRNVDLHHNIPFVSIKKNDGLPAYQLVSLIDDINMGVTHIVRGIDLVSSTAAQLYLSELLLLTSFSNIVFYHHPLITDSNTNQKLSKSNGSFSLMQYKKHDTVYTLYAQFANWLGLTNQATQLSLNELKELFIATDY